MMKKGEKGDEVDEEEWGENKKKESIGRGKNRKKRENLTHACMCIHTSTVRTQKERKKSLLKPQLTSPDTHIYCNAHGACAQFITKPTRFTALLRVTLWLFPDSALCY